MVGSTAITVYGIPRRPTQALRSILRAPSGAEPQTKGLWSLTAIVKDPVELHGGTIAVHSVGIRGQHLPHDSAAFRARLQPALCHLCAADYWWWMTILIFCDLPRDRLSNRKARSRVPQMERPPRECWQTHGWMGVLLDIAPRNRWVRCSPVNYGLAIPPSRWS